MKKRIALLVGFLALFAVFVSGKEGVASAASAQEEKWPTGNLTLVVPFNAGGGLDASARLLAKYWETELGVKLIIDNRGGANGQVGTSYFMRQPDDGSYILVGAQIYYSSNILLQGAKYTIDDVFVLNYLEIDPCCLAVSPNSPYKTFEDVNAAIKANPGKIRVGVTAGSPAAIMTQYLIDELGWNVKIVNYDGGTERLTALMGGHIDVGMSTLTSSINNEKILALWAETRNPAIPDVPTLRELFKKDLPFVGTSRFVGVHSSMKEKYPKRYQILLSTLEKTHKNPEYQQALKNSGRDMVTYWFGPEESNRLNHELHESAVQYKDSLGGS